MARRGRMSKDSISQAQRALRVFRSMQPTLNAYARMLSGRRDIRVAADTKSNGSTDGKTIYYRPPISLGADVQHKPWLCDKRDDLMHMLCPACQQRESILSTIYHEIAHIWFDSFQPITEESKERAIKESISAYGGKYAGGLLDRIRDKGRTASGYMELAGIVSPFFPLLLNALEDARVNRELFKALPGTKVMFDADTVRTFELGVEQIGEDGEWINDKWSGRPLNLQAIVGVFCMASGYDYSTWLNEFVVHALADKKLGELVNEINSMDSRHSVDATFQLAFPVLARLRELGFLRDEEDPEDDFVPPYEEEPEPSEEEKADGEPSDGPDEGDTEPADSDEEGASSGDDSERSDDSGDGGESDEGTGSDEPADPEDEVGDDDVRGDSSGERSGGPEADGDSADEEAGDESPGTGPAESGTPGGPGSDSVSEEDSGGDSTGTLDAAGPDDPDNLRDEEGVEGTLVGSDPEAPRLPDGGKSSGSTDDSGDAERTPEGASDGDELDADDVEPLDIKGGGDSVRLESSEPRKPRDIDWGTADDIKPEVIELGRHDVDSSAASDDHHEAEDPHGHRSDEDEAGDKVVKAVLVSSLYFEGPSQVVNEVKILKEKDGVFVDDSYSHLTSYQKKLYGVDGEVEPSEATVGPALLKARIAFSENYRGHREVGLRNGRVHGPSLARRAPVGDDRLFQRKHLPGRRDYFVGIGIDCSGSTAGKNIHLAKQVAFAEAEVLSRLGIPFFMYGHSGGMDWSTSGMSLDIIEIKTAEEPWNDVTRKRLKGIGPRHCNLDGHTIQFYRKMLERQKASDKILHYYSDGSMPAENFDEELEILREELVRFRRANILLPCVGIRTDAPRQHGLHTVRVDSQEDVLLVVKDLEELLTAKR